MYGELGFVLGLFRWNINWMLSVDQSD